MRDNKLVQRLDSEIGKRLESTNWNLDMAHKVIGARKKSRKKVIYISSMSSFSFAALMIIFFVFGISTVPQENIYEQFITKQVQGTYSTITGEDTNNLVAGNNLDVVFTGEIDSVIDDTLSMR